MFRQISPAITDKGALIVTVSALIALWLRGIDYVTGDSEGIVSTVAEQLVPVQWWGAAYIAAAVLVTTGLVLKRPQFVIAGAFYSSALYSALAAGVAVQHFSAYWLLDGARHVGVLILPAVTWWCISRGTWITMRAQEVSQWT